MLVGVSMNPAGAVILARLTLHHGTNSRGLGYDSSQSGDSGDDESNSNGSDVAVKRRRVRRGTNPR